MPCTVIFPPGAWRRSSFSGPNGGTCVEVNLAAREAVGIRDSKLRRSPVLVCSWEGWLALLDTLRQDQPAG
ncbi:DUF397 domain-containing protein [Amycolatopsis sp. cg5]|uniref:DUF397 domain-containing protein n=1 Tax=Amycolatopsis sp. cg5 TaxID=3238802 RepID=UPI00352314B2